MSLKRIVITVDESPESPCEADQFKVVSFDSRYTTHEPIENYLTRDEDGKCWHVATPKLRTMLRNGTANWLDYYEHGLGAYSLAGEGMQCQWDTSPMAGIILWEGKPEDLASGRGAIKKRREQARSFLEEYNAYFNGQVYDFIIEDDRGNELEDCRGGSFYGTDDCGKYMAEAINEHLDPDDEVVIDDEFSILDTDALKCRVLKDGEYQEETILRKVTP